MMLFVKNRNGVILLKGVFNFRSIRSKMLVGFILVLLLVVFLGSYVYYVLNNNNDVAEQIKETELPLLIADEKLALTMLDRVSSARAYILSGDEVYKDIFIAAEEESEIYEEFILEKAYTEDMAQLIEDTDEWEQYIYSDVFKPFEAGDTDIASE